MTKIVLIGAGSVQFGSGMLGDIFQSKTLSGSEIVLNDINAPAAERVLKIGTDHASANGLDFRLSAEPDLSRAMKDADFAVISIEVGDRFALWDLDWQVPRQYGIQQIYGENGGPGGLFHSLRVIPPILDICRTVSEVAPDATVFNFSNPMSRICTTVHRAFPDLKFIGMCHEIASLERHLPPMLDQPRENLAFRAAGLNHFSVLADIRYIDSGRDAYPDVREKAPGYFASLPGYSEMLKANRNAGSLRETEGWMKVDLTGIDGIRPWSDRWLFREILERFGYLPITSDSHFGEYIPWAHDSADHRGILDFYTFYRHALGQREPKISEELHERIVPMIEAMVTDKVYEEAAVNIPNFGGLIANLPKWITVETPAMVSGSGVSGIAVDLPAGINGLLANQIGVHDLTALAVLNKSRDLVIQALLVDPTVGTAKNVPALVDHMIAEQSPWLDYLK